MQILAQVGESDISRSRRTQPVEFTVQALQGQTFKGTVKQVRLQSTTTDNVVNYTVVVSVDNTGGKLLPGMTARANFLDEVGRRTCSRSRTPPYATNRAMQLLTRSAPHDEGHGVDVELGDDALRDGRHRSRAKPACARTGPSSASARCTTSTRKASCGWPG